MKYFLLCFLFSTAVHADYPGLKRLRTSFAVQMQKSQIELDRAATFKKTELPLGGRLIASDCETLQKKIALNYPIDPFKRKKDGYAPANGMCGGPMGWMQNSILRESGVTNLGLPYTMVIQYKGTFGKGRQEDQGYFFINDSFQIVEIQQFSLDLWNPGIISYDVRSLDASGNLYASSFERNGSHSSGGAGNIVGERRKEMFLPVDGSSVMPMTRETVKDNKNSANDYMALNWDRADKIEWQSYFLLITLPYEGGFYDYNGTIYGADERPRFKSHFSIKFRGGKEVCANGSVIEGGNVTPYPTNDIGFYRCRAY